MHLIDNQHREWIKAQGSQPVREGILKAMDCVNDTDGLTVTHTIDGTKDVSWSNRSTAALST
jgi:hypothetical protein